MRGRVVNSLPDIVFVLLGREREGEVTHARSLDSVRFLCKKKKEETNPEIHKEFICNFETIFSDLMVITNLL